MKRLIPLTAAVAIALSTSAIAADASDIRLLNEAKISLSAAILIAEKSQGGRAIEASLDDDSFSPAYEVTVVKDDNTVHDVQVDAVNGKVIGARQDIDD